MTKLLIDNVASSASDEDVGQLLLRYGFPPYDAIEHLPGDGSRTCLLLTFADASPAALRSLQPRIQHLFWNDRKLEVEVLDWHVDPGAGT
jgi:hypothetical protein